MTYSDLAGDYKLYFEYLVRLIGGTEAWEEYGENLVRLFERSYYWTNPVDGGLQLHVETLRGNAISIGNVSPICIPNTEPSILEVLVHLAIEIDLTLMHDPDDPGGHVGLYFTDLFEALGFDCPYEDLDLRVDQFLDGSRRIAGKGTTLWQQCNYYYWKLFNIENEDGL